MVNLGTIDAMLSANKLVPEEWFRLTAASACSATASARTDMSGVFRDTAGSTTETLEQWSIDHSNAVTTAAIRALEQSIPKQDIVEWGAIAVIAAVLLARHDLRIGEVQAIGTRMDYRLVDKAGAAAGCIEFAGISSKFTSTVAERKRKNVKKSGVRPARIGIVAFGGFELRLELVA